MNRGLPTLQWQRNETEKKGLKKELEVGTMEIREESSMQRDDKARLEFKGLFGRSNIKRVIHWYRKLNVFFPKEP